MTAAGGARGGEEFDDVGVAQGEVGFIGLSLGAVVLGAEGEAEDVGIEMERAGVVGRNDGDVVEAAEGEGHFYCE